MLGARSARSIDSIEIDGVQLPSHVFIENGPRVFRYYVPKQESVKLFHDYLDLHRNNPALDIQMLPVSVMFGRSPGREGHGTPHLRVLNGVQKFFAVLWLGRDSFVRFLPPYRYAEWPVNTVPIKPSPINWHVWRGCTSLVNVWPR